VGSADIARCPARGPAYPAPDAESAEGGAAAASCPEPGHGSRPAAPIPPLEPQLALPPGPPPAAQPHVRERAGIVFHMNAATGQRERELELLESVRCLGCGAVYAKPGGRGTAVASPGCPECGYVGWVTSDVALDEEPAQRRYVAGRRLLP
jgi:hypothetical protein